MRFFQIVIGLKAEPETLAGSERSRKSYGGIGGDASFAEHDLVDPAAARQRLAQERSG